MSRVTLDVRGPSYHRLTRSISWLLMNWLLASPGHQQPRYWLCKLGRSWSYMRKDFNHLSWEIENTYVSVKLSAWLLLPSVFECRPCCRTDMWCHVVDQCMFRRRNNALWEDTYTGHQPGCYCLPCSSVDPVVALICDAMLLTSVCFVAAITRCGRIHTLVISLAVTAFRVRV